MKLNFLCWFNFFFTETDKDTRVVDMATTFVPQLKTFEMDIAEEMGIEDDRVPKKTYWY